MKFLALAAGALIFSTTAALAQQQNTADCSVEKTCAPQATTTTTTETYTGIHYSGAGGTDFAGTGGMAGNEQKLYRRTFLRRPLREAFNYQIEMALPKIL